MSSSARTILAAVIIAASLPSCTADPRVRDGSENSSNSEETADPDVVGPDTVAPTDPIDDWLEDSCHYDCFGSYRCSEGNVYETPHAPLPCSEATEENIRFCDEGWLAGECEEGCVEDVDYHYDVFSDPWTILCNEGRPRIVGDPCETDADCQPVERPVHFRGDVVERTLLCDENSSICIDPDDPDFMAPCDLGELPSPGEETDYAMSAPACASEHCAIRFITSELICQGCAPPCEVDTDCPAGSRCRPLDDLSMVGVRPVPPPVLLCIPNSSQSWSCGGDD
ncbi:MAG: hypothetical protein ACNA8W_10345 [Bradymonadaceae bacterium]